MDLKGLSTSLKKKKKEGMNFMLLAYWQTTRDAGGTQNLKCGKSEPNALINAHIYPGSPGQVALKVTSEASLWHMPLKPEMWKKRLRGHCVF